MFVLSARQSVDSGCLASLLCGPVNLTGTQPQNIQNNIAPRAVAIIPARYASSRFPGKALVEIDGKPMICCVTERAAAARNVARVIVATDDQRISDAVRASGFEAVMTRSDHPSGTDRIAEVAASLDDAEIIVNVQGDEPLIAPETIERAVEELRLGDGETGGRGDAEIGIVTTWERIESIADVLSPDTVKIVVDHEGCAIYFSRSPVPYPREAVRKYGSVEAALENDPGLMKQFRKHTGLYVYRRDVLLALSRWPQTELEKTESLEQLRALEHGVKIRAVEAATRSIGVDTVEDLQRVRTEFKSEIRNSKFAILP
ncbi:MAG TPA: 3-deoxy-manno-octulosonate cytidylyltransferase [Pyrinomonadaceae bacterium]|nr:3-deoxy-manno-octulosonate cytidylyltransferase [Pyrinomonadaceae bacterium]